MRSALLAAALAIVPAPLAAQQFVTDDAATVGPGACQLEAWYARPAAWVLPACQLVPNLEFTVGLGAIETPAGTHALRYVLQGKTLFRELEPDGLGIGLVAGVGLDPLGQIIARRIDSVFAYVPTSVSLGGDAVVLHQNLGWTYGGDPEDGEAVGRRRHALTWGVRGDVRLTDRVTAIAELFGQSRVVPEYQVGVRLGLVPERLHVDLSYTAAAVGTRAGTVTVGVAWTPAPWFHPP